MTGNAAVARGWAAERSAAATRSVSIARVILVTAVVAGVGIRLAPVLFADFPLNDGGMFFAMIRDLQHAGYLLPPFTSYNAAGLPFTYPPLPFYVGGLLDDLTPLNLLEVLRFLPATLAVLTVGAFYLLARSFRATSLGVAASVAAFALLPESFVWLVMGGGLTRSFGMVFALLGARAAYQLYAEDRPGAVPWLILWSSLTVLSHLETASFLALTVAALCISWCRSRRALLLSVVAGIGTLACTAPWWLWVMTNHGWGPFGAALQTGYGTTGDLAAGAASMGQILALVAALALLAWRRPRPFYFGWIGLIALLNARSFFRLATIPIALAVGDLVDSLVTPRSGAATPARQRVSRLGFAFLLFLIVSVDALPLLFGLRHLAPLSPEERLAMAWVADSTPPTSQFLVVSGAGWAVDRSAEWFPVLAERASLGTVQGSEWAPQGSWARLVDANKQLQGCARTHAACLDQWSSDYGLGFTHVYVPVRDAVDCCMELRASLRSDSSYTTIHDGAGASIFARRPLSP